VLATARIVSGKWTLLILRDLAAGPCRFTQLERSLAGISPRTLSQRLRALEEEGIIAREVYPEAPPRVEYRLTAKGCDIGPIVDAMRAYGEQWLAGDCADSPVAPALQVVTG
jgi:DNA-binding HxlR family transcriptional regulator